MSTVIKQPSVIIKCSNPSTDFQSIRCTANESSTKRFPIKMLWLYSNSEKLSKDDFMPSKQLQTSLADALNYFPILCGRVQEDEKGNATIHLTNEGVLYTEAECLDHTIDYFIPRSSPDEDFDYENINRSDFAVNIKNDWTGPGMSIQVTRLKCNSVVLTISAFHCLMDAQSVSHFINVWASGKPPQKIPTFDKSAILYPNEQQRQQISSLTRPEHCVFNRNAAQLSSSALVQQEQQRVITKVYYFSVNELNNIKKEASKGISIDYISTYDALYAHMILVISAATQTTLTDNIKILQAYNGRSRFVSSCSPAILNYFGLFSFWLSGTIPTDREPTLSTLAQQIHEMYSKQTVQSLRDYNAYLMSDDGDIQKNQLDADIINRDFHCTSWRKFNLLGANFGNSGFPIYSGSIVSLYPRYFPMMDANAKDESVNILLGLREQDYERMIKQNMLHKYR